jgi:hypothetical protein
VATPGNRLMNLAAQGRLLESRQDRNGLARWFAPPLPWAVLTFALVAAAGWPRTPPLIADSIAYRAMALGQFGNVPGSISGRLLHPLVVRFLSWASGLNVDGAFFVVALVTVALLIGISAWILRQATGFGALVLPLLLTPVLVDDMFGLYYCQDLFYAALLSCFFVALIKGRRGLALMLLFPLYLARESTILLALAWVVIAWFESDFFVVAVCAIITFVGFFITRKFAAFGVPNVHHTNEFVFLALKPPFDSLRNFLGLILVPSEMKGRPNFNSCTPFVTINLPSLLSYGSTRQCGICCPDLAGPLHTFRLWFSLFGIGPAVVCVLFKRNSSRVLVNSPLWLKLATIYGLFAFIVAPFVSLWLERDVGYAWPVFWLAVPALFVKVFAAAPPGVIAAIILENLAACWIPFVLVLGSSHVLLFSLAALSVSLAMQAAAFWTLRSTLRWNAMSPVANSSTPVHTSPENIIRQ